MKDPGDNRPVTVDDASAIASKVFQGMRVHCPRCGRETKDSGCTLTFDSLRHEVTTRCSGGQGPR